MYFAFPIKKSLKKAMGELAKDADEWVEILRETMPRCSDGRVMLHHPLRNSGSEYVIRNRMEQFRNYFGGEKDDEWPVHSLFTGSLKRLAQAYGFMDGRDLLSYTSSMACGELMLAQCHPGGTYYLMCFPQKEWKAAGLDLHLSPSELDAMNLSVAIYAAMSQVQQLLYIVTRQYVNYPLGFIPLCDSATAAMLADACGYQEFQYIDYCPGSDTACLLHYTADNENKADGELRLKLSIR